MYFTLKFASKGCEFIYFYFKYNHAALLLKWDFRFCITVRAIKVNLCIAI